ncbi:hypothetical protein [Actinomadura madurae]|uniref:hypothetical protein n=1 Tax=Actinomadura madurae TaxID=1993 RepID=UPI0020D24AE1|nr:hypothetical protein [Actinomadura madurae]MCQ0014909.1 hypothetical protein [Actinomadura madurae]
MSEMPVVPGAVGPMWSTVRRLAGYGAAASLSLYLAVKIVWVVVALLGHAPAGFGDADWIVLNTVTVGMSATGVALGLVLAHGPAMADPGRAPGRPRVDGQWVPDPSPALRTAQRPPGRGRCEDRRRRWRLGRRRGAVLGTAADRHRLHRHGGGAGRRPPHLHARTLAAAFLGRLADREPTTARRVRTLTAVTVIPAVLWTYWSLGGTRGLDPAHHDLVDFNTRLLMANSALWALLGIWSIWAIASARPNMPVWLPTALGFVASGSLFAWSSWKLAVAVLRPGDYAAAEYPAVTLVQHGLAIAGGVLMMTVLTNYVRR